MSNSSLSAPFHDETEPPETEAIRLSMQEVATTSPKDGQVYIIGHFDGLPPDIDVVVRVEDSERALYCEIYRNVPGKEFLQKVENGSFWCKFNLTRPILDPSGEVTLEKIEGVTLPIPLIVKFVQATLNNEDITEMVRAQLKLYNEPEE